MGKFEKGKTSVSNFRTKATKGYKRFSTFANATALTVLVGYAGQNIYSELRSGDRDAATVVLTLATVLVGLTAAVIYIKFFTEDE